MHLGLYFRYKIISCKEKGGKEYFKPRTQDNIYGEIRPGHLEADAFRSRTEGNSPLSDSVTV